MKRRRPIDPTAALRTLSMAQTLSEHERDSLRLRYWAALDALKTGHASDEHIDTLAGAINVALVLAERTGHNADAIALIQQAQDALMRAKAREQRHGTIGLDGPGAAALGAALELHDAQLALHTAQQLQDALIESIRRMRAGDVLEVAA